MVSLFENIIHRAHPSYRDEDLQKAIRLSEQEAQDKERKQREKLERENQEKLFGSNNQSSRYNESLKDGWNEIINI